MPSSWIPRIRFGNLHERYDPHLAIGAILNCRELIELMRRTHVSSPSVYLGHSKYRSIDILTGAVSPGDPAPHLPRELDDLTVEQALATVAMTFKGAVVYLEQVLEDGTLSFDVRFEYGI